MYLIWCDCRRAGWLADWLPDTWLYFMPMSAVLIHLNLTHTHARDLLIHGLNVEYIEHHHHHRRQCTHPLSGILSAGILYFKYLQISTNMHTSHYLLRFTERWCNDARGTFWKFITANGAHTHTSQRIRNCLLYSFYIYPCWHFPVHSLSHWMMDRCKEKRKRNVLVHVSLFRCILWHYNTASVVVIQCVCVSFSLCFAFRLAISMRCRWWYHFIIIWARRRQDNRTTMCDVRSLGSLCVIHIFMGNARRNGASV